MSYSLRNTLILLVLVVIVFASGEYSLSSRFKTRLSGIELLKTEKKSDLDRLRSYNKNYDEIEFQMRNARAVWVSHPKHLKNFENSVVSFDYFNTLASRQDSRMNFDFRKINAEVETKNGINSNLYNLTGEARFVNLFRFIWKLENFEPLYTIEELEIEPVSGNSGIANKNENYVHYYLTIRGYSVEQDGIEFQLPQSVKNVNRLIFNPFNALVQKNIPPNKDNLLNADRAVLLGISASKAILMDASGKSWTLRPGDKVYLGSLTEIDARNRTVEFTLNVGGFLKKIVVNMKFKNN